MAYPPLYIRLYNFLREKLAGATAPDAAKVDSELNAIGESLAQTQRLLRGIVDPNGRLRFSTSLREMKLLEQLTFTATAAQTQFNGIPAFDVATDRVEVFIQPVSSDLATRLDPTKVALADFPVTGNATFTNGSAALTAVTSQFVAGMVGAAVYQGTTFAGYIQSYTSGTAVTLDRPWTLATVATPTWSIKGYARVTITPAVALVAGQKVTLGVYTDGAGVLTKLNSLSASLGASLVAIADVSSLYVSANVEAALAEVMSGLNSFIASVGSLAEYVKRNGSVAMTGALQMGNNKVTGMAAGTVAGDAVEYAQFAAAVATWNNLATGFLALTGGTMQGVINMGGNGITNLPAPTNANDAARKADVDLKVSKAGDSMTGILAMGGNKITGLAPGVAPTDAATVGQIAAPFGLNRQLYTTPGAASFIVPAGVTKILVEAWGGGGGGVSQTRSPLEAPRRAGAGGGYASAILTVVPGETISLSVGAGGASGANGGDTTVARASDVTFAMTGGGGKKGGSGGTDGNGGAASVTPSTTTTAALVTVIVGGDGGSGGGANGSGSWHAVGGNGGSSPRGGQGGAGGGHNDSGTLGSRAGGLPGGGGGNDPVGSGSAGSAGGVQVTW